MRDHIKELQFSNEARASIQKGINKLADAVVCTLGVKGRNVLIEKPGSPPDIVNDGVTIAKNIRLENRFEDVGVELMQEVGKATDAKAGDGTTTCILLAREIINEGIALIEKKKNPMELRDELKDALLKVIDALQKQAKPVRDDQLKDVATISCGGDEKLGAFLAEVFAKIGVDGAFTKKYTDKGEWSYEIAEGYRLDKGWFDVNMSTDDRTLTADLKNVPILVTDRKPATALELKPLFEKLFEAGENRLVIFTEGIERQALHFCIANSPYRNPQGNIHAVIVEAPSIGEDRRNILKDVAFLTGAKFIDELQGISLKSVEVADLGRAESLTVTRSYTQIVNPNPELPDYIAKLKSQLKDLDDKSFGYDKIKDRIRKLEAKSAVINIPAMSDVELSELKLRIDDALNALRCAVEDGIVAGGGASLFACENALQGILEGKKNKQTDGERLLQGILRKPAQQMANNAGMAGELASLNATHGYNFKNGEYVDLFKEGIIDPLRVVLQAIKNAVDVASTLLTTECIIIHKDDKKEQ